MMNIDRILMDLEKNNPGEKEFQQAVREVLESIEDIYNENPYFESLNILDRLIEPDRMITFKVPWTDDDGKIHVNRGFRIQFNNAIGPYKGGLRFHPNLNIGILKFLAFEQVFKNCLTCLPMGGAKGGADFNPKGKSEAEIMRFCQSYMLELWKIIGPEMDVPSGDIGVGTREIGYLYGMYKKLTGNHNGAITGKGIHWGGSPIRPESTGYGVVFFLSEMLRLQGDHIQGKKIALSGFGNVAWGVAKKATELGARIITISGPDGYIFDPDGISGEKIDYLLELRISNEDIVKPYSYEFPNVEYNPNKKPWGIPCDIAIPCAIQNELDEEDAARIVSSGCRYVCEASNMSCTRNAIEELKKNGIVFAPSKAANAGGVSASGLEMSQNAMKYVWTAEEVEEKLSQTMKNIHNICIQYGRQEDGKIDYARGANIAGFLKIANAMADQGVI